MDDRVFMPVPQIRSIMGGPNIVTIYIRIFYLSWQ